MKRIIVKQASIPALVIGSVIALGIGGYAFVGSGKNRVDLNTGINQLYLPQMDSQAQPAQAVQAAARGFSAVGAQAMNGANMASWIKPSLAVLFTVENRLEQTQGYSGRAGSGAQYPRQASVQVTRKLGTGVIVHPSGYILTNNHLVEGADSLLVKINGVPGTLRADLISVDPRSDLCLLKVQTNYPLPVAAIHRANHIQPGERLMAVSLNPDMTSEARRATVSGVRAAVMVDGASHTGLISLDRALTASFTGAPLIDQNGFVAGLALPVDQNSNGRGQGGYAISTKTIRRFLSRSFGQIEMPVLVNRTTPSFAAPPARAMQAGLVREAPLLTESNNLFWLGINFQNLEPAQAKMYGSPFPKGAMVNFIHPQGPAASSGIQTGDIILKANGRLVRGADDIAAVVRRAKGGSVTLQIFRQGKRKQIIVPSASNPTLGMAQASMGMNVARQTFSPAIPGAGFNRMTNAWAPEVDMDRMMSDQRNRMIIEKAGLDPALLNMRLDGDLIMRMARDRLVAVKLGIDPALMAGRDANRTMVIRKTLWRDLAGKLGIDPNLINAPGIGAEQFLRAAKNRILAESLGVAPGIAAAPGITNEEIARIAVNNYLTARLGITKAEIDNLKAAPPSARTAQTAVVQPGPATGKDIDPDRVARQRRMENIVASLGLDPNLLSIPGIGQDRLLQIAGDRYLAARLGVKPAFLDMPGFDRDMIIRMAVNERLAQRLGLPAQMAGQRRTTSERILKMAENRVLAGKLGLPASLADSPGMSRDRLLKIAGDRMLASALGASQAVR